MKEKTLQVLEYSRIIDMLKSQAGSEMTKNVILWRYLFRVLGVQFTLRMF